MRTFDNINNYWEEEFMNAGIEGYDPVTETDSDDYINETIEEARAEYRNAWFGYIEEFYN